MSIRLSMKLLPASVSPVDTSQVQDVSTSLVLLAERAITQRTGQNSLVPSTDAFAWSSSTRRDAANRIYRTPVDDSQSDETGRSDWEYVSGWAWSFPVENTVVAHYLSYAVGPAGWSGRLINVYA